MAELSFWEKLEIWPWKLKKDKTCEKPETAGYIIGSILLIVVFALSVLLGYLIA